jgi:tRNA1Val (adenine37-N6)-methyltransferase
MEAARATYGETINGLLRNKIRVIQAKRGYRVSEDALILTWFFFPGPNEVILDAGAGCGVIAFGVALKEPSAFVVALEIQAGLADRAQRGVQLNGLESQVCVIRGDVREADNFLRHGIFDAIISNPPYLMPGSGRISPLREKALARHQLMMPAQDLFRVAACLIKPRGRLSLIYPVSGMIQIEQAMKETGFAPSRMLWIHPRRGSDPNLVCVEACREEYAQSVIEESLLLYEAPGRRTPEADAVLAGEDLLET